MKFITRVKIVKRLNLAGSIWCYANAFLSAPIIAIAIVAGADLWPMLLVVGMVSLWMASKMHSNYKMMRDIEQVITELGFSETDMPDEEVAHKVLERLKERGKI